ncbi:MAG: S9 family peptidase [Candidatus Rokubacteria bacterium]|nr:S9 family peptidase [Candidatus Rokubacteria bacterium]
MPMPPVAKRVPRVDVLHGETLRDDYAWLRDKDDPEVLAHLRAENAYTDAVLKPTEAFQAALYAEMLARIKEDDRTVPFRRGDWLYSSRTEKGKQYPIYCRKRSLEAPEEVTLDLNVLAEGHPFCALGAAAVSDDGVRLAYTIDFTGFREFTLYVKNLATGALEPDRIERVASLAWTADPAILFYVTEDAAKRPHRLWRHRLGATADELVYEEPDELFRLGVARSRSLAYVFAVSGSHTATEARWLRAAEPGGPWRLIAPRERDHEYEVEHGTGPGGDLFYLRTNGGGRRNFRLVTAPVADPSPERWTELIAHREDVMLENVDVFAGYYVVQERVDGLPRLRVTELAGGATHHVAFPEPAYEVAPDANAEFVTPKYRFRYQSFITPLSVFDYDMASRERVLLKRTEVLGGYDPTRYRSERVHATAADGTRVPIALVRLKDAPRDGTSPMLLTGYGAYGLPYPVTFASSRLSLLDRGVTVAIAHVRGGGELGKRWHDAGRMLAKRNSFTDFIAAADFLVAERYTARDRLVVEGGSAGGLLIGAVLNLRPDLCRAALLRVPFVDVLATMLDESLPLTVGEFEEWGNPKVRAHYDLMKTYCPYTNLAARAYPAILVKTSVHDSQVMFWEPAKWVARLRTLKTDDHPLLLKTNLDAGHGGSSGRYDALRELALDYAFVLGQLGRAPAGT